MKFVQSRVVSVTVLGLLQLRHEQPTTLMLRVKQDVTQGVSLEQPQRQANTTVVLTDTQVIVK